MYLKSITLVVLIAVSSLTIAEDKKGKKAFKPTEKSCAKVVSMIEKFADNEKRLKRLNKRKAQCEEAGL